MDIKKNVIEVRQKIQTVQDKHQQVNLVAATKYASVEQMMILYHNGITKMGENRVDALLEKKQQIQFPIEWHFIGTLQSRKVKEMINEIDCLHSLDRISLAKEIEKHRKIPLKCFIQVNTSNEETKKGLEPSELVTFIESLKSYSKIEIIGLMTMAPHTGDIQVIRSCFQKLRKLQQNLVCRGDEWALCNELSMGMSHDYLIAIEEGATCLRLGSTLLKEQ